MNGVKAEVEYRINYEGKDFHLDRRKYDLLRNIDSKGSITNAAKVVKVSYRTALNYIGRIEDALGIPMVITTKGGKGGGGSTILTSEALSILNECKKIDAIMDLHKELNEITATVVDIDAEKRIMSINIGKTNITIPINQKYEVGDEILALISYDNIFLMLEPQESSIRNIMEGTITEMSLENGMMRVKIDLEDFEVFSDVTLSAGEDLDLKLGKKIYVGFKALSIATLKI